MQVHNAGHSFCFALLLLFFMALNSALRVCYSVQLAVKVTVVSKTKWEEPLMKMLSNYTC